MSEQPSQDRSSRRSRLARLLPWNWRRGRGDTIQASVGKEAQFVVVGKNVIQIGRVQVPIWLAAVSALAIVAGAGALIYTAVIADSRLGSIEQRVQATDTPAPTPSPTPTATPEPMSGDFNIALARPVALARADDPIVIEFQDWYVENLKRQLLQDFEKYRTSLQLNPAVEIVTVQVNDVASRHTVMADYAQRIRAHVLIYGFLDPSRNPAHVQPEFYIHPDLLAGAEETTGNDAFGEPLAVRLTEGGADSLIWKADLKAPVADFSAFMSGLSFFEAGEYRLALEQFETLYYTDAWATETGRAILYLWLGTTHHFMAVRQAAADAEAELVRCVVGDEAVDHAECARLAYTEAIQLKPEYPRAYIGLGNYWLEQDRRHGCERIAPATAHYLEALAVATAATGDDARFIETSLVVAKVRYQLGLTHARALFEACPPDVATHDTQAIDNLEAALLLYGEAGPAPGGALSDLASRSAYMMGRVHNARGRDDDALAAYERTSEIAAASLTEGYPWTSIRWVADNQRGAIYLAQVENGQLAAFEPAKQALHAVTQAYDDQQFGVTYADLPVAAAAAFYHLGRLHVAMAVRPSEPIDRAALIEAETFLTRGQNVLAQMDAQIVAQQGDELVRRIELEQLHVARLTAESYGDIGREDELAGFLRLLDAIEQGEIENGQVALSLVSEAAYGAGAIYAARGDGENAVAQLDLSLAAGSARPSFSDAAQALLDEIERE